MVEIDELVRSRRKTIGIVVTAEAKLLVRAPMRVSLKEIEQAIVTKERWIKTHQQRMREQHAIAQKHRTEPGGQLMVLGQRRTLVPDDRIKEPVLSEDLLFFPKRWLLSFELKQRTAIMSRNLRKWLIQLALKTLVERTEIWSKNMRLFPQSVSIGQAKTQWGSCTHNNQIRYSFRLVMAPIAVIDYVVVHELSHIAEKNHSSRFWHLVHQYIPEAKDHRAWLRANQSILDLNEPTVSPE